MLFSPRETVEARLSSPTINPQRAVLWLMINNAIVKFAEHNMKRIITGEKISLTNVLNFYKDHYKTNADAKFLSEYLCAYVKERTEKFAKDKERGDFVSSYEIDGDNRYKFEFKGKMLFAK